MNLFILRHGTAVNNSIGLKDFDRNLSEDGILQAVKIGDFLKDKKITQIICSSAKRAIETASIVDELIKTNVFIDFKELYLADASTIKNIISEHASDENVLFVGHNFGISDLASDLSGEPLSLSTCMLIELELQIDVWYLLANETGILKQITEPNQL